ncbi:MAG: radical SAM family heme chaperone HemW [Candidatus Rokuibacteriota bacterium]
MGRRPALAPLVAARELYSVALLVIQRGGSPERPVVVAGSVSPAHPEGGLKQTRPGSGSADNPFDAAEVAHSSPLAENPPEADELGFYVHVPFCAKRCGYCSFNTAPLEDGAMARYLEALHREIDLLGRIAWSPRVRLSTIFLGGGTPSLMAAEDMAATLDRIRARFNVAADAEITVECNPESVTRDKLAGYSAAGVNRLSLGVQSLDDSILPQLGRLHDARGARAAFEAARAAGCDNLSVDLMYGLPGLDPDGWTRAVEAVLDWKPDHLSAYGLTLDAGSLWGAAGVDGLPTEDAQIDQYWRLARAAAARGLEHYEISNYARPGYRSRHNQIYWHAAEYLAAGPGACGFVGRMRYANLKATPRYCQTLAGDALPVASSEHLSERQRLAERLILGLRTADGIPAEWLEVRLDGDGRLRGLVEEWRARTWLIDAEDRVRLTEAGFLLSDALFVELL